MISAQVYTLILILRTREKYINFTTKLTTENQTVGYTDMKGYLVFNYLEWTLMVSAIAAILQQRLNL